jgi:hypothetical protein
MGARRPKPTKKKPRLGEDGAWIFGVDGTCTADHEAIRYLEGSTTAMAVGERGTKLVTRTYDLARSSTTLNRAKPLLEFA